MERRQARGAGLGGNRQQAGAAALHARAKCYPTIVANNRTPHLYRKVLDLGGTRLTMCLQGFIDSTYGKSPTGIWTFTIKAEKSLWKCEQYPVNRCRGCGKLRTIRASTLHVAGSWLPGLIWCESAKTLHTYTFLACTPQARLPGSFSRDARTIPGNCAGLPNLDLFWTFQPRLNTPSPNTTHDLFTYRVSEPAQPSPTILPTRQSARTIAAIDLTHSSTDCDTGRVGENEQPLHRGLWAAWYASAEDSGILIHRNSPCDSPFSIDQLSF